MIFHFVDKLIVNSTEPPKTSQFRSYLIVYANFMGAITIERYAYYQ